MTPRFVALIAVSLTMACRCGWCEDGEQKLSWPACVREAALNNPDLAAALQVVGQARANRTITMSPIFPQASADMRSQRAKGAETDAADSHFLRLLGQQLFFDGFKTVFDTRQAGEEITASAFGYYVVSSQVRFRLRSAFADLLRAQDLIGITRNIAARRKQNTELVQLRYQAGREHRGSLMLSEANLAQAEYDVREALRAITLGQRRLSTQMGRLHLAPIEADGNFTVKETVGKKPDLEGMADRNPFLKRLITLVDAARFGVKSAKANFLPRVTGDIEWGKAGQDWPPNKTEWAIGAGLSYPLFEGRRRVGEVSRSRAVLGEAASNETSGRESVVLTLEEAWKGLQDFMEQVGVQSKVLAAAEERAKIARAQYATGLLIFDDWTIIEDDLVRAKKTYLDAQAAALVAEANWVLARGGTLEGEMASWKP